MPQRRKPGSPAATQARQQLTPAQFVPGFSQYLSAECGLSANTLAAYTRDVNQFCVWTTEHGSGSLTDTSIAHLTDFLGSLRDAGLAPSSISRKLVAVKMFFRYLMLEGLIAQSAADLMHAPKLWQHLPKVLSPDMVDRLIEAPGPSDRWPYRDRALLALLYATGCRVTEVCTLTLGQLYLAEGYCRCTGKGNKQRVVSLNPIARERLELYLHRERALLAPTGNSGDDLLLLSGRGRPLSRIEVWKLVKRYAARIGASREISPHTLRHSFATHMLAGGAEIRALQELLGHASIRTTQIYTQVEHSRLKSIHERCHPRG